MLIPKMLPLLLLLVGASACGDDVAVDDSGFAVQPASSSLAFGARAMVPSEFVADSSSSQVAATPQKLIRNADIGVYTADVDNAVKSLDSIVTSFKALKISTRISRSDGHRIVNMTLRVPADKLDSALSAIGRVGELRQQGVSTDDVTKAYVDIETRLAVKEQTLTHLRSMLDTKAVKLSDVLDLEREIARTLSEIEQMKGDRRYYDQQVEMSMVQVMLTDSDFGANRTFLAPIRKAFASARNTLGTSVSAFVYAVIFLTPWLLIGVPIWRAWRRRRRAK